MDDFSKVCGRARVFGDTQLRDYAIVEGDAVVAGDGCRFSWETSHAGVLLSGEMRVTGHAFVGGDTHLSGDDVIEDYTVMW